MCVHSLSPGWQLHKSSHPLDMFKDRWGAPSWQNISCPRTITQHVPWLATVKYKYALAHCIPQHLEKSGSPPHVSSSAPFLAEHITWHIPRFPTSFALTLLPCSTSFPMVLQHTDFWSAIWAPGHYYTANASYIHFKATAKGFKIPSF